MQENSRKNKDLGDQGESVACEYLARRGFEIVDRNVKYKTGEIDIIARRSGELHFIEVKSRIDPRFVPPIEVVDDTKKMRIRKTAELYLNDRKNNFNYNKLPPCFFGVIGVDFICGEARVECVLDAFI